jgi:hypothetical protein
MDGNSITLCTGFVSIYRYPDLWKKMAPQKGSLLDKILRGCLMISSNSFLSRRMLVLRQLCSSLSQKRGEWLISELDLVNASKSSEEMPSED